MGTINGNQFKSSYLGDQIDALLAAMAQANPLPSGTDWVAFIDDCRAAQTAAEAAQAAAESAESGAASSASTASTKATQASSSASTAAAKATLSESWAVGGTGTRTGENTNNAKYWSQQAQHAAGGGVTSWNNRSGVVLPQNGDYSVGMITHALSDIGKGKDLLINSYFKGGGSQQGGGQLPINASPQTTLIGAGYICTGWYQRFGSPTTTLTANGIKSEGNSGGSAITQSFENGGAALAGQPLTLSALFQNAGLVWGSCAAFDPTKTLRIDGRNSGSFNYNDKTSGFPNQVADIRIAQNDYLIAARLEYGDAQTLARNVGTAANPQWVLNDPAPDYQTEFRKCQFYQQILRNPSETDARTISTGLQVTSSGYIVFPLSLAPMRLNQPNLSFNGSVYVTNGHGTDVAIDPNASFAPQIVFLPDSGIAEFKVKLDGLTRDVPLSLCLGANASITIDANIPNT